MKVWEDICSLARVSGARTGVVVLDHHPSKTITKGIYIGEDTTQLS